ncbi:MAG: hypothetical protein WCW13_06365 [archaeon]|jgi:hypothetical protein
MDLAIIVASVVSFLKLLILVSVVGFVLYKIFSPLREKLAEKYSLSWIKSALLLNFVSIFVLILIVYLYFMIVGVLSAPAMDPALDNTLIDYAVLIISAIPRVLIASLILSLLLLVFELIASFFMVKKEARRSKKTQSLLVNQIVGVVVSCAIFLLLLLFIFDWVPLGLFIYIFYGSIEPLPAIILF